MKSNQSKRRRLAAGSGKVIDFCKRKANREQTPRKAAQPRCGKAAAANPRKVNDGEPGANVIDLGAHRRERRKTRQAGDKPGAEETEYPHGRGQAAITPVYFNMAGRYKLLNAAEERVLARAARRGDLQARDRLMKANLRLVISIARQYQDGRIELMELVSEGNLGLMKAIEKYDPERGFRFSTYATWWIRDRVLSARMKQSNTVHIPIHTLKLQNSCLKAARELRQQQGFEPDRKQVARKLGKRVEAVERAMDSVEIRMPLDSHCHDSQRPLHELLPDENNCDPSKLLEDQNLLDALSRSVRKLSARYQEILVKRFGLFGEQPRSVLALSRELGIRRATINKWINAALLMLQDELHA